MRQDVPPLVIVDVGASGGINRAWRSLPSGSQIIGFEPDENECKRLNDEPRDTTGPIIRFVPIGLGKEAATLPFYETLSPYCSSNLRPIAELIERYPYLSGMTLTNQGHIDVVAFDEWCVAEGLTQVDYLKLDTQGTELDILQGAENALGSALIIETEVEFNPLYENQALFGEVDAYLRGQGFTLWVIAEAHFCQPDGVEFVPVKDFGKAKDDLYRFERPAGQLVWGQAFFVRDELLTGNDDNRLTHLRRRAVTLARARGIDDFARTLEARLGIEAPLVHAPVAEPRHEPQRAPDMGVELNRSRETVERLRAELEQSRAAAEQARAELTAVRASRSFRYTRVLRALGSLVSRIGRGRSTPTKDS